MAKDLKNSSVKDMKTLVENPFTGRLVNPKYLEKVLKKKKILQQNTKRIPSRNANKLNYRGGMFGFFNKDWQKDLSIHAPLKTIKDNLEGIHGISHDLEREFVKDENLKQKFLNLIKIFIKNSEWYKKNEIFIGDNDSKEVGNDINKAIEQFIVIRGMFWDSMTNIRRYMIVESSEISSKIRNIYKETFPEKDSNRDALELYNELIKNHNPPTVPPTEADDIIPSEILQIFLGYKLNNTLNTLSSCRDLLNTYITNLKTSYLSKTNGGGRKMKALKSPNTPKKATPKKATPKKATPKKTSNRK